MSVLTQEEFIERVKISNPFIEVIGNYINNKTKILKHVVSKIKAPVFRVPSLVLQKYKFVLY